MPATCKARYSRSLPSAKNVQVMMLVFTQVVHMLCTCSHTYPMSIHDLFKMFARQTINLYHCLLCSQTVTWEERAWCHAICGVVLLEYNTWPFYVMSGYINDSYCVMHSFSIGAQCLITMSNYCTCK